MSYSVYGERGSIGVLASRRDLAIAVVVEVKTELTSVEATLRKHDEKGRLAGRLVRDRGGLTPKAVGRLLVMPESRTTRRRLDRRWAVLQAAYPLRGREVCAWLRAPTGSVAGVMLLPDTQWPWCEPKDCQAVQDEPRTRS